MDQIRLNQWTLEQKEKESRKIIREAIEKYGKDRLVLPGLEERRNVSIFIRKN